MAIEGVLGLTPEQMARTPVVKPPAGVRSNLVNPPSNGHVVFATGGALMVVMYIIAALRYYTRVKIVKRLSPDDWTTMVAIFGTTLFFALVCYAVVVGKVGTHLYDLSVAHFAHPEVITVFFLLQWVYAPVWAIAKTTFFVMYLQLFHPFRWMRWANYIGLVVTWLYYLAVMAVNIYFSIPRNGDSWAEHYASLKHFEVIKYARTVIFSVVLDVYIYVLPIAAISKLGLSRAQKIGVSLIFMFGFFACVASGLTFYYFNMLQQNRNNYTYYLAFVLINATIEMCVGISASCMPPLVQLFNSKKDRFRESGNFLLRPFFSSARSMTPESKRSKYLSDNISQYPDDVDFEKLNLKDRAMVNRF